MERAIRLNLHFQLTISEREPPTHVLRPRYSIPTIWILISSLPQVAFHSNLLSTKSKSYERELSVGETIIWSTRARSSSSTHHLLPFGEWCLLDWLGVTWEPPSRLWSWTKEFVRARRSSTSWRSTLVRQVLRGRRPWWIDKVASSWTLRGWSPPWTRATITLRGLKSPSTWMYDSTTYRNHAKNIRVSNCVWILQTLPFTFLQVACFTFRCQYTLCMLAWIVWWLLDLS